MNNGYIAVDFFFILSGFLIAKSSLRSHKINALDYTINKLKRFLPETLIVLIPTIAIFHKGIITKPERILDSTFLLFSNCGLFSGNINSPLWYLSVLLIGGGLLYSLIGRKNENLPIDIILILTVLCVYTYIIKNNDGSLELWDTVGCFYIPLWRGIAGMGLGVLINSLYVQKKELLDGKLCKYLTLLCVLSMLGYIYCIFEKRHLDAYALLFDAIIILTCFSPNSIINKILKGKIWGELGSLSFQMLIVHLPIVAIMSKLSLMFMISPYLSILLYTIVVLLASYVLRYIGKKLIL